MHFWTDSAEVQFIQTKAQFSLKFYFCVSSFNQETANQVLDTIKSSHSAEPCEALKKLLLKLFALNDFLICKAISNLPLSGDIKSS